MTRKLHRTSIAALLAISLPTLAAASPGAPAPQAAGDGAYRVSFVGTLANLGDHLPRRSTQAVKIWIDRLTTDAEAATLAERVRAKGPDALEQALFGATVGRLQIGDRLGYPIAFARRFADADGEHLLLIAQRPISFREIFRNTRSRDYPYTVVELDLDASGHGSGEVLSAARVRTLANGEVELQNLEFLTARLLAVSPLGT